jgi:hypothetical protein
MIKLNWLAAVVFLREGGIVLVINHYIPAVGIEFANRPANRRQARSEEEISLTLLINRKLLDYDSGVYFVKIILLLIGRGDSPLLPIGWSNLLLIGQGGRPLLPLAGRI